MFYTAVLVGAGVIDCLSVFLFCAVVLVRAGLTVCLSNFRCANILPAFLFCAKRKYRNLDGRA